MLQSATHSNASTLNVNGMLHCDAFTTAQRSRPLLMHNVSTFQALSLTAIILQNASDVLLAPQVRSAKDLYPQQATRKQLVQS